MDDGTIDTSASLSSKVAPVLKSMMMAYLAAVSSGPSGVLAGAPVGTGSGYRRRLTAPPLVAGGTVYAMDAYGMVTALDAATGRRRWEADTRPRRDRDGALGGGIAFEAGRLYAVTGLAEAMAIDAEVAGPLGTALAGLVLQRYDEALAAVHA